MKNIIIVLVVITAAGIIYWATADKRDAKIIGGDRSPEGCLVAAGYSYSAIAGACIREFELTEDIKRAAGLAVEHAGSSYGLTVTSFNSYEEPGSYDITLEGPEFESRTFIIKNWTVVE
jgi:hypothetical protein